MVKCAECGFLATRRLWSHELVEAAAPYRDEGQQPTDPQNRNFYSCELVPVCAVQRRNFVERLLRQGRTTQIGQDELTREEVRAALLEEYDCAQWTVWHQGFTPKEHREMLDRQSMHRQQVSNSRWNLAVAVGAVIVALAGTGIGAKFNADAAHIQADAQIRSAEMQIQAMSELATRTTLTRILPMPDRFDAPTQ
jgi:hypothetical protein